MIGILPIGEALKLAQEQEIDLVEVAPLAKPPVAKLIDYSKFLYQLKKKKKEEKKGSKTSETKQIRFGPFIGEHDLDIKIKKAKEFLTDGDKVKFAIRFTGRQMGHQNIGREKLEQVIEKLGELAKVEREMKMEGRQLTMMVTRNK
jgi:translation initiation factor IF-3